jgi:hypothetical protein
MDGTVGILGLRGRHEAPSAPQAEKGKGQAGQGTKEASVNRKKFHGVMERDRDAGDIRPSQLGEASSHRAVQLMPVGHRQGEGSQALVGN